MPQDTASNTTGVMLTLAALTAMAPTARPSGETLVEQEQRIAAGISTLLANDDLWSAGWSLEWLALSSDRANMAYIASTSDPAQLAVCIRGTVFSSWTDRLEDLEVESLVASPTGGNISQGAMNALDATLGAQCVLSLGAMQDTTLMLALARLLEGIESPTVYVTGHSLGGCVTTMLSLYLAARMPSVTVEPYTFAAPTAGDAGFAQAFDARFPNAVCVYNLYDAVPRGWQDLPGVESFFPSPGPSASTADQIAIAVLDQARCANVYVQPARQPALNTDFENNGGSDSFFDEIAHQHYCDTYLELLGAPTIIWLTPSLATITPWYGTWDGGTTVTIEPSLGRTFTPDCVVDFGATAATSATVAADGSSITATTPSDWAGAVSVSVTNMYGTSNALTYVFEPF